jgi:lipopolysaccharide exporter
MIKPVLGSSYRQYILSLWLPFYLSLPTLAVSYGLGVALRGHLPLGAMLAAQITAGALAFAVMIVLSRNALVVEMKRQFCRSEKMKTLLRAG